LHESEVARLEEQHAELWRQMQDEERTYCVRRSEGETELLRLQDSLSQVQQRRQHQMQQQQYGEQQELQQVPCCRDV
jgi:hypothetical protein